ncbi:MAG TPA: YqgE/AlgH family protein [Geminicoccaceae bacterium]|nr:YqgE/AlgH family protein [Geminicoccaceae bacterium]
MRVFPSRSGTSCALALLLLVVTGAEAARSPSDLLPGDRADPESVAGRLLVATPELEDPNFYHTIVYMVKHDGGGAMGLVLNRVLGKGPVAELLEGLGEEGKVDPAAEIEVHFGGPVESGRGFVLHSPDYDGEDTVVLSDLVALTSSLDVLRAIAAGEGPKRSLLALGYAGWAPGQLEAEITAGAWEVVEPDEGLLFDDQVDTKWQRALDRRGIDL